METKAFESWAVVEVMGRNEYAGFVTTETIGGAAMLRVDVPAIKGREAFTKYLSAAAIYGISPCSEATARAKAEANKSMPFEIWSVENMIVDKLREDGKLLEVKQLTGRALPLGHPGRDDDEAADEDFDDDDEMPEF
jgi:hypothetical protein